MESSSRPKLVPVLIALVILGATFFGGYAVGVKRAPDIYKATDLSNKDEGRPAEVDFSPFWRAWEIINEKYVPTTVSSSTMASSTVTSVTDQDKVWGAISGLTASLGDPYTVFFPPEEQKEFQSEISGTFEGVGMEIGIKDGILTVIAPLKGTPADRAGIQAGDKILKINDEPTDGMSTDAAVRKIRGKGGTTVRLTLARTSKSAPFDLSVVRETINIPTIDTELKLSSGQSAPDKSVGLRDDGVFVIKLYSFTAQSPNLFRSALREFVQSGSNKLILDLRSNPGGYLEAAVDIASWFLPVGKVVVQEEYAKDDVRVYRSKGYDIFNENLRMAILVNGGSASASEILAGALREQGVAKLVGTQTFGKGSVQELVDITPDTSLKVTVARWLTPNGKNISKEGLKPDYVVDMTPDDLAKGKDPQMQKAVHMLLSE